MGVVSWASGRSSDAGRLGLVVLDWQGGRGAGPGRRKLRRAVARSRPCKASGLRTRARRTKALVGVSLSDRPITHVRQAREHMPSSLGTS